MHSLDIRFEVNGGVAVVVVEGVGQGWIKLPLYKFR